MPLRHPFTVLPNGRAAQLTQDSDAAAAQELAFLLLTRRGERPLLPEYGAPDPTYDVTGVDAVAAHVAAFGPDITIVDVDDTPNEPGAATLTITFTREDSA